jgi:hypothetical protein
MDYFPKPIGILAGCGALSHAARVAVDEPLAARHSSAPVQVMVCCALFVGRTHSRGRIHRAGAAGGLSMPSVRETRAS